MLTKGIIDRFEQEIVVLEVDGIFILVPRVMIPNEAIEGDVVIIDAKVERDETRERRKRVSEKLNKLSNRNKEE